MDFSTLCGYEIVMNVNSLFQVATGSMVFLVTLSSYGVYTVLQSYRRGSSGESPQITFSSFDEPNLKSKEMVESPARVERPTSLNVGKRAVHAAGKFDILSMIRSKSLVDEDFDLEDVEDMGDIQVSDSIVKIE